jgi:hypothetical protein
MQRDRPDVVLIEMLMHLEDIRLMMHGGAERLVQGWQIPTGNVHDRAVHLGDGPHLDVVRDGWHGGNMPRNLCRGAAEVAPWIGQEGVLAHIGAKIIRLPIV